MLANRMVEPFCPSAGLLYFLSFFQCFKHQLHIDKAQEQRHHNGNRKGQDHMQPPVAQGGKATMATIDNVKSMIFIIYLGSICMLKMRRATTI